MDSREKIILPVVQHIVIYGDSGSHQLGDASFDQFFRGLRILELLADGHTFPRTHKLGQVCVKGMVGKSCQLDILGRAVGAAGESDAEYLGCRHGILRECLVKVSHAKKQNGIGMLLLHRYILFHQWCLDNRFCHVHRFFTHKVSNFSGNFNHLSRVEIVEESPHFRITY